MSSTESVDTVPSMAFESCRDEQREVRKHIQAALDRQSAQLSSIERRFDVIEHKQSALDLIAQDLEQVVQGLRFLRTAKIVTTWIVAIALSTVAAVKFLMPSIREVLK